MQEQITNVVTNSKKSSKGSKKSPNDESDNSWDQEGGDRGEE